jgi:hypothetical protein
MSMTVNVDSVAGDDRRRAALHGGELFVYSPRESVGQLAHFARTRTRHSIDFRRIHLTDAVRLTGAADRMKRAPARRCATTLARPTCREFRRSSSHCMTTVLPPAAKLSMRGDSDAGLETDSP